MKPKHSKKAAIIRREGRERGYCLETKTLTRFVVERRSEEMVVNRREFQKRGKSARTRGQKQVIRKSRGDIQGGQQRPQAKPRERGERNQ